MATIPLDELTQPLTVDQAKSSIYSVLATVGVNTTSWKPGAVVRTIIAALAIIIAAFSQLMALIARSGFLELSSGTWLTLVARYHYFVERFPATFATGQVTVSNTGGGVFHFDPGDFIAINSTTKKTYRNVSAFDLAAGQMGLVVDVQAIEAGSASTSLAGTIDSLETPLLGVTITNALALIGQDEESDQDLINRCLDKPASLSPNGPREAYQFFAKSSVLNGSPVGVNRVAVSRSSPIGQVTVTVADASGTLTGSVGDLTTKLGVVDSDIQNNVVPEGVSATVQAATPVPIAVTANVFMYDTNNIGDVELTSNIQTAISAMIRIQPIGGNHAVSSDGFVHVDLIRSTVISARPEIFHVEIFDPIDDVPIGEFEAPTVSTVSISIIRVTP